jgi:Raf kinase inhibitor-like YbhB/YbcL family protein
VSWLQQHRRGLLLVGLLIVSGCSRPNPAVSSNEGRQMQIQITSPLFLDGDSIPQRYTCDGEGLSPPLVWENIPTGTQSLVLIMKDPDAPSGNFIHWLVYNIPPGVTHFDEGILLDADPNAVGIQGKNSARKSGYYGPCPPSGKPHHYKIEIYALDGKLNLKADSTESDVVREMNGHVLGEGLLSGMYGRQ